MRTSVITLMLFVLGTTLTVQGQQHPRRPILTIFFNAALLPLGKTTPLKV